VDRDAICYTRSMSVRVWIHGRVVYQREMSRVEVTRPEYDENGQQIFYDAIAPGDVPQPQPLTQGKLWRDPDTKLFFRVVDRAVLRMNEGWASEKYWCDELHVTPGPFTQLCREGLFDCAAAIGEVRRYRCLDYAKTMVRVRKILRAPRLRGRHERPR
jgi:hypothetical protein